MEAVKLFIAGISMGSGPCLVLWGPFLLPFIAAVKKSWYGGLKTSLTFSLGRLSALALLGWLAVTAFASINRLFPPHRSGYLYLSLAIFIIFIGIFVTFGKGFKVPFFQILRGYAESNKSLAVWGFLMGIAPCAPLIAILTYIACTATNGLQGILYALSFGMGTTVPVIILGTLTGYFSAWIAKTTFQLKILRIVSGIILILFGIQLLYKVLIWL